MWVAVLFLLVRGVATILIHSVYVPEYAEWGTDVELECNYSLERDSLYSQKWYKDRKEIFRYFPSADPPFSEFRAPGVTLDMSKSNRTRIHLTHVTADSAGKYRCEVSADAPSFQTMDKGGNMSIIVLPTSGPKITGFQQRYKVGEYLSANCSTYNSIPRTNITWFINDGKINSRFYINYRPVVDLSNKVSVTSGLTIMMQPIHFMNEDNGRPQFALRCRAVLANSRVYDRSEEVQIFQKPQRRQASQANSREMESSCGILSVPSCLLFCLLLLSAS